MLVSRVPSQRYPTFPFEMDVFRLCSTAPKLRFGGRFVFGSFGSPFFGSQEPRQPRQVCLDFLMCVTRMQHVDLWFVIVSIYDQHIYTFSAYTWYVIPCYIIILPCVSIFVVSFCVMFLLLASTLVHVMQILRLGPHEPPSVHSLEELPLLLLRRFGIGFKLDSDEVSTEPIATDCTSWFMLIHRKFKISIQSHFSPPWCWWKRLGLRFDHMCRV